MPTSKQLAKFLGLSARQVRRHSAAGMPTSSFEAAAEWYHRNIDRLKSLSPTPGPQSLPAFFENLADAVRDAVYHFAGDDTPKGHIDALVGDAMLSCRDFAREAAIDFRPNIEKEVRARFNLSDADKRAADARAARRWRARGGGYMMELAEDAPEPQYRLKDVVWTEKGKREIGRQ